MPKMKTIQAVICYGVYKDYDGHAHDSRHIVWTSSKVLARRMCRLLNKDDYGVVESTGHEWASRWTFQSTIALPHHVITTLDGIKQAYVDIEYGMITP